MKKISMFIIGMIFSAFSSITSAESCAGGAMGNGGNGHAMNIYRCVVSDSSGHMQSKYVPRYYCEYIGGKVIF
ncbi:hypothetical protein [Photobacterium leiognathi]|uniref:hypothetical protein n=1 Tax=Photobacterium leiognathi TaxID=553611 RepID=UPI002738803D|nr:hypothetical protein [Photobacterium leiognathi]